MLANLKQHLNTLVGLLILAVPLTIGTLNPTAEICAAIAAVISIGLISIGGYTQSVHKYIWILIGLFAIYYGIHVLSYFYHPKTEASWNALGTSIHFVLIIPILLVLAKQPPKEGLIWLAIIGGAVLNGIAALNQDGRTDAGINPIFFGNFSVFLAFGSVASWYYFKQFRFGFLLPILGFTLGIIAVLLSQSRGSWLAVIPLFLITIGFFAYHSLSKSQIAISSIAGLLFLGAATSFVWDNISPRITIAISETQEYFTGKPDAYKTSVGARFEMYKGALLAIKDAPIMGHGIGHTNKTYIALHEHGLINDLSNRPHAHNQLLEEGIRKGIIGILSYVLLMAFLAFTYLRIARQESNKWLGLAGLLLITEYVIFGLTDIVAMHGIPNTFFISLVGALTVSKIFDV